MAKLLASIHVYDCLDNVELTALVREYADYQEGDSEVVLRVVTSLRGAGISDPRVWLQDALIGLIEHL